METSIIEAAALPFALKVDELTPDLPLGEILNVHGLIGEAIARLRELKAQAEAVAVENLKSKGRQTIGETDYWAGPTKDYKPRDFPSLAATMMRMAEPKWFVELLSTSAFKQSEVRKLCEELDAPDMFDEFYETRERWEMKDNQKRPSLQSINRKFVPSKATEKETT